MMTAKANFKIARRLAVSSALHPSGFKKGKKGFYVRAVAGQIHAVDFQLRSWESSYFVNIAFTYDFLPPDLLCGQPEPPSEYSLPAFLVHVRLKSLLGPPCPSEWRYDGPLEIVGRELQANATAAVVGLSQLGERWRDPNVLIRLLPVEMLEAHEAALIAKTGHIPSPINEAVGFEWYGAPG